MSLIKVQRRKLFLIALAAAFVMVCFFTSSSSLDVSKLDFNTVSGLFDPRPEELDTDLQDKDAADVSSNKASTKKPSSEKVNPEIYLGDNSEYDQYEELPKTNAEDPDMEDEGKETGKNMDDSNPGAAGVPANIPEPRYPDVPRLAELKIAKPLRFRIYSHNIKNGEKRDLVPGETPWDMRRVDIVGSIKLHMAPNMIIVLQEALEFQLSYILAQLNLFNENDESEWIALGGGRIDGKSKGEYVPIILRKSEWDIIYTDTFWLNNGETRTAVAGWDAKYPRICTYGTLKNKESGAYLNMFNTHFDHKGDTARIESARLLMNKMDSVNEWPSLLSGDLNSKPDDKTHQQLISGLRDVHNLASSYNKYGHREFTVTGFLGARYSKGERIDYIFAPSTTRKLSEDKCPDNLKIYIQLESYSVLHSKYGGTYMSDHRPLMAQFMLGGCNTKKS
ncbi:CIC11C00000000307 [Sungouiella intermedia]|uniref:CIC11C00000000307 n=1 Tax=Sungouiella intermedia TaxID=45354 RepID=A0A1L0BQD9_9ASCO|nr:CIC11C00000000307 [[Candida] intermedia]